MTGEPPLIAAASASEPPPTIDDDIYQKLIKHSEDIQGLLAYGIFRQSERDWIKRFYTKAGRLPTDREISDQFYFSYDEGDIRRLRDAASDQMVKFAFSVVDEHRPGIEKEAVDAAHDAQLDELKTAQVAAFADITRNIEKSGSLWRAVLAGIISSIVFAVLTLIFVAIYFAPGIHDIIKALSH